MEFGYQMGQGKAFVQGGGAYRDGDASRSWRMTARGYPPYSGVAFRVRGVIRQRLGDPPEGLHRLLLPRAPRVP